MASAFGKGRPRKPKSELIRRNKQPELIAIEGMVVNVPDPPDEFEWQRAVIDEWYDFWDSPLATLVNRGSDMGALIRLFQFKNEMVWALDEFRTERSLYGHVEKSPTFRAISNLEKLIHPLEDRFGMSPAARLRLGASLGDANESLSKMNAALDLEVSDEPQDEADPRDILELKTAD